MKIKSIKGKLAKISSADKDLADIKKYRWRVHTTGYFYYMVNRKYIFLHRIVLARKLGRELKSKDFTDHKDRDKLNNLRSNLRVSTNSQNQANQSLRKDNTSGCRGVNKLVIKNKYIYWCARIRCKGKRMELGCFKTFEEAKKVRDEAALKYFGEFASID